MIAAVVLLWALSVSMVFLVVYGIRLANTPVNPDVVDLQRYRDARDALGRISTRHSISVPTPTRRSYGATPHGVGTEPLEQVAHAAPSQFLASGFDVAHANTTPARYSAPERRAGLLDPRHT